MKGEEETEEGSETKRNIDSKGGGRDDDDEREEEEERSKDRLGSYI